MILLMVVGIGAIAYMSPPRMKVTYTLIIKEYSNSGAMRYAMRTKIRIDSVHVLSI